MAAVSKPVCGLFPLQLEISRLLSVKTPVQETVEDVSAFHLGLGPSAPANLRLRARLKLPGGPFGGLGFFDPQCNAVEAGEEEVPPAHVTLDFVRRAKLSQFQRCADGEPSFYFWALQPMYDTADRAVAAEILVRCRNGSDSAPYEDLLAIKDPHAPEEVRSVYSHWKATEIVDWSLQCLKDYPILQNLSRISTNVAPSDMGSTAGVFQEVSRRCAALSEADRKLLQRMLVIEVTEDQVITTDLVPSLKAWQEDLGFRLAYDDTIGQLASEVLDKKGQNYHTTVALEPLLEHFGMVKVDIEWAGYALFLSHPSYSSRPAVKAEVLGHARDEDELYIPQGPGLKNTHATHSGLLTEFAAWVKDMMAQSRHICIELTVRQDDESNAFALGKLKEMGLDIFGAHQDFFCFQGGPTGAKAFEPAVLAEGAQALREHCAAALATVQVKPEMDRGDVPRISSCKGCLSFFCGWSSKSQSIADADVMGDPEHKQTYHQVMGR